MRSISAMFLQRIGELTESYNSKEQLDLVMDDFIWLYDLENPNNENKTEIHFVNKNIINKEINSVRDNLHLHKAFTDTFNELKQKLNDRKPKRIIACSQVTYNSNKTLKELSKNRTPSCGLIINETVHSCDWTDDTNMTIWAFIFIY